MKPAERARSALFSFLPGGSHDETIRLGASFMHAGGELADWLAWRATDPGNKGEQYNRSQWRTYEGLNVGPQLIFFLAQQENDWHDPDPPPRHTNGTGTPRKAMPRAPESSTAGEDTNDRALDLWLDGKPAHEHPYVNAKGLRDACDADRLRVAANDPDCLLVPVRALTDEAPVVAVQRIFKDGAKRSLGRLVDFPGCCYVIGELRNGVTVIGCEGVATGEAIAQACPTAAVVVTVGVSREREVMGEIRALYPASPRVIVADRGRRVADATRDRPAGHIETITARAAQETRSAWVSMPAEVPEGYDAWDFATERGHDALAVWIAGLGRHEYEPRYKVLSGAAITSQPIIDDLVDDVIPAQAVGAIWGASGVAKSFLVLDLAASLTECRSFFGHDVFEPAPVLIVSLEGNNGLPRRYLAWEKHNGRPVPARLHTLTQGFSLLELQRIAFDVIGEQLRCGENIGAGSGCPAGRPCIAFAQAVDLLAVRLVSYEAGKRRWKASKVIEAMQPKFYATDGEWLWRV